MVKLHWASLKKIPEMSLRQARRFVIRDIVYNAYDADADWVKITFMNFDENYRIKKESKIIIEDNGSGIKEEVLKNWFTFNYSTRSKKSLTRKMTKKGRQLKGGNGAGRFRILSLGKKIKITTRIRANKNEYILNYDFSKFKSDSKKSLDDVKVSLTKRKPKHILTQGTIIEISALNTDWSAISVENVFTRLVRRQFVFKLASMEKFNVYIYKDDKRTHHILYSNRNKLLVWLYVIYKHILAEFTKLWLIIKNVFFINISFLKLYAVMKLEK